jgi:hypothetical protein
MMLKTIRYGVNLFCATRLVEMASWRWLDCRQYRLGATHFLTKGLEHVKTEMSLHVLAYNFKRLITVFRRSSTQ